MDKWRLLHTYRDLAAYKKVPAICCPDDFDIELVPVSTDEDDPALFCFVCRTTFYPGSDVWKIMKENISELRSSS